jgi:hypothetical protein
LDEVIQWRCRDTVTVAHTSPYDHGADPTATRLMSDFRPFSERQLLKLSPEQLIAHHREARRPGRHDEARAALASHDVRLTFQRPTSSVVRRADTGGPYLRLIPDTVASVGPAARHIPIDAKYKRYSRKGVEAGDVAQSFTYAMGFAPPRAAGLPHGLIVYPSESGELERTPLVVRHHDGTALRRSWRNASSSCPALLMMSAPMDTDASSPVDLSSPRATKAYAVDVTR